MAKTRASLFSILESHGMLWEGAGALDLFAGCGSLGLECLSRGAAHACFVDKAPEAVMCLRANVTALSLAAQTAIEGRDVASFLRGRQLRKYNVVFIDPPYRKGLAQVTLELLCNRGWLANGAFVVAELEKGVQISPPPCLTPETTRLFGQTCLEIWRFHENSLIPGNL